MIKKSEQAFDIFPWNRNFESGIALVDEQHQELVRIINHLAAHLANQASNVELNQVFADLAAYANYHFEAEESIWQPVFGEDDAYIKHQHIHASFLHKVMAIKQQEQTQPLLKVAEDLLRFLTHWLAYHILDNDKRMAKTVLAVEDGLSFAEAKQRADNEMSGMMEIIIETVISMYDHLSARKIDLMQEIHKRRKVEAALKLSRQREQAFSDTLMQAVPGLLYLVDDQLRLVRWNERVVELTGFSHDELANKCVLDFFAPEYHADVRKRAPSFYQDGYTEIEGKMLSKDGQQHPFLFTAKPLIIEGGSYFVGMGVDISLRKQAEARLRLLSSSLEQASDAVLITDRQGVIGYVNPAFCKLTGYSEAEALGSKPNLLKSRHQDSAFYDQLWQTINSGQAWHGRIVDKKKDGSFYPAMLTISSLKDATGRIKNFVGMQQDLTAYESLELQFYQAQKMEALGTLVGGIAHDFNNMLAGIVANIYLVKQRITGMPEITLKLTEIEKLIFRSADMIQQLLTFARKDQVSIKRLPLTPFIKETCKVLRNSIEENIGLHLDLCNEPLYINGDTTQLHQLLMNLITNARDALEHVPSPRISVRLQPFTAEASFYQSHAHMPAGQYAHLSISDNGCGIPGKLLEHIFEPFFTTKAQGKGTGLGLAMVFGAIKNHHGYIYAESHEGNGTTFHIYLPRLVDNNGSSANPRQETVATGHGQWILLVDDDVQVLSVGKELLESIGYQVHTASNGVQAIAAFTKHQENIALIMMDVVMPVMGGVEAAHEIRKINARVKLLFCTGYDKDLSLSEAIPVHSSIISKPYQVAALSHTIQDLLPQKPE